MKYENLNLNLHLSREGNIVQAYVETNSNISYLFNIFFFIYVSMLKTVETF